MAFCIAGLLGGNGNVWLHRTGGEVLIPVTKFLKNMAECHAVRSQYDGRERRLEPLGWLSLVMSMVCNRGLIGNTQIIIAIWLTKNMIITMLVLDKCNNSGSINNQSTRGKIQQAFDSSTFFSSMIAKC